MTTVRWQDIEEELIRLRQDMSLPRPNRNLGEPNRELREQLFSLNNRYTRGLCMDFAVGLALINPGFKLAGFYAGQSLIHAFVTDRNQRCYEVSGVWTMSEMRRLHADDGKFAIRYPPLEAVLSDIERDKANGAQFDDAIIMEVAGCLPHLRDYVPQQHRISDPEEALRKLNLIVANEFTMPMTDDVRKL